MAIKDLMKWNNRSLIKRDDQNIHPIERFHRDIDKVFENFFTDFRFPSIFESEKDGGFSPKVNVSEDHKNVDVSVELPGMNKKDIEVSLKENILTIKGEKNTEKEEKKKDYYHVERSYGKFQRSIKLPAEVEDDKVDASFKDGILNIRLPKTAKAQEKGRLIEINS